MAGPSVFLSYRRDDTGDLAEDLAQDLKEDLGLDNVFRDVEDLRPGVDFDEETERRLRDSDVTVALIGDGWAIEHGVTRIAEEDDWVRREIRLALSSDVDLMPVLVDDAELPVDVLPDDIAPMASKQQLRMKVDDYQPGYQGLLTGVWYLMVKDIEPAVLVIADDTAEAEVAIDELVAQMEEDGLVAARDLSRVAASARGLRAIPITKAAKRWPEVIFITGDTQSASFKARARTILRSKTVKTIGVFGAGMLTTHAMTGTAAAATSSEAAASLSSMAAEASGQQVATAAFESASEATSWMSQAGSGSWWAGLTGLAKAAVVAGTAGVAAVAITVAIQPDPIDLAGSWAVSEFEFQTDDNITNSVNLSASEMLLEPEAGCTGSDCSFLIVEGPSMLAGVLMEPIKGGSEFTGSGVRIISTCGGAELPQELYEATLRAFASDSGDDLSFEITVTREPFRNCGSGEVRYLASGSRI